MMFKLRCTRARNRRWGVSRRSRKQVLDRLRYAASGPCFCSEKTESHDPYPTFEEAFYPAAIRPKAVDHDVSVLLFRTATEAVVEAVARGVINPPRAKHFRGGQTSECGFTA
jgi:hypothetical protein